MPAHRSPQFSSPQRRHQHHRCAIAAARVHAVPAFTLVELLVVISIVALLVSMLLPTLAASRQSAQQTACSSNLRQIGMAIYQYTNDNKETYPPGEDRSADATVTLPIFFGWRFVSWPELVSRYLNTPDPRGEPASGTDAYLNPTPGAISGVFSCPSIVQKRIFWNGAGTCSENPSTGIQAGFSSYAGNAYMMPVWWSRAPISSPFMNAGGKMRRVGDASQPWNVYLLMDGQFGTQGGFTYRTDWAVNRNLIHYAFDPRFAVVPSGAGTPVTAPEDNQGVLAFRHMRQFNMLYLDGHVNQLTRQTVVYAPNNGVEQLSVEPNGRVNARYTMPWNTATFTNSSFPPRDK